MPIWDPKAGETAKKILRLDFVQKKLLVAFIGHINRQGLTNKNRGEIHNVSFGSSH